MIDLINLSVGYPRQEILHDVNMTIPDGQLTILAGPNGSGKSTLLKTIAGILPPRRGSVIARGILHSESQKSDAQSASMAAPAEETIANASPSEQGTILKPQARAQLISYLPQSRNVPEITAFRMVLHGRFPWLSWPRHYSPADTAAAEEAMKQTDSWDLRDRLLTDLSGGERQKVYLAMILAQDTPIVLMDEPTTYLDIDHQLHLMQTARRLSEDGRCVIIVLHDLTLAMQYADLLILLHDNSITAPMTPEDIFESGQLDAAFHITLRRFPTDHGWRYYYSE